MSISVYFWSFISHDGVHFGMTDGYSWMGMIWQRAYNCHEKPSLPHLLPNKWPPDSTCPRSLPYSKSNCCQPQPAINPCSAMTFFSSKKGGDSLTALQNRDQVYSSLQIERSSKVVTKGGFSKCFQVLFDGHLTSCFPAVCITKAPKHRGPVRLQHLGVVEVVSSIHTGWIDRPGQRWLSLPCKNPVLREYDLQGRRPLPLSLVYGW